MLEICHAKKMSVSSPCGWNYNLRCGEEWLPLCQISADEFDTRGAPADREALPHLFTVSDVPK